MMEAEYGVGIKNRFAFLNGDEEEDESFEIVPPPVKTNATSGNKPKVVNKENKSGGTIRAKGPNDKQLKANESKQGEKNVIRNGELEGKRRDGRQPQDSAGRRDTRQGYENGERGLRQNNRERNVSGNGTGRRDGGHGQQSGEFGNRRDYRQGQQSGENGYRRDYRQGQQSGENSHRRDYRQGQEGGERNGAQDGRRGEPRDRRRVPQGQEQPENENGGNNEIQNNTEIPTDAVDQENAGDEKPDGQVEDPDNKITEERTLTLAEWKALQQPREKPVYNIRKPGEGDSAAKIGKLVLKKKEDDLADEEEEYETDEVYYPQRAGKFKLISDVGFNTGYQRPRRGGGSRGGPGGAPRGDGLSRERDPKQVENPDRNGGRPRGGYRGGRGRGARVPRIDDTQDFPTLG